MHSHLQSFLLRVCLCNIICRFCSTGSLLDSRYFWTWKGVFCFFLNLQRHYRFLKSFLIADGSCSITVSGNQSPGLCFSRLRLQVTPHWTEILSMSLLCHHYIWLTDLEIVVVWALLRGNTSPRRSDTAASVISGGNVLITANEYSWRSTTINRREC